MKKLLLLAAALLCVFVFAAPKVSAALTQQQIDAVINLIASFGADSTTLAKVKATLNGGTTSTQSSASATFSQGEDFIINRPLSYGATGADVMQLQKILINQGLLPSDSATGYFGAQTQTGVQHLQAANGIVSTGNPATTGYGAVGPRTQNFLEDLFESILIAIGFLPPKTDLPQPPPQDPPTIPPTPPTPPSPSATYVMCGTVSPRNIIPESGNAYLATYVAEGGDTNATPQQSKLVLFENGVPIGTPHTLHQTIRDTGRGLYSHWYSSLRFAASDNSDPRINGRVYAYGVLQGNNCPTPVVPPAYTMCGTIAPASIQPELGFAYIVYPFVNDGDTSTSSTKSWLMVFENGVPLWPPHTLHQTIRDIGKGRFSHWYNSLRFAALDNSDPRTNGKTYTYGVLQGSQCPNFEANIITTPTPPVIPPTPPTTPTPAPTSTLTVTPTSGTVPLATTFTGSARPACPGLAIERQTRINFGDGQTQLVANCGTFSVAHTYATVGSYSVKLETAPAGTPGAPTWTTLNTVSVAVSAPVDLTKLCKGSSCVTITGAILVDVAGDCNLWKARIKLADGSYIGVSETAFCSALNVASYTLVDITNRARTTGNWEILSAAGAGYELTRQKGSCTSSLLDVRDTFLGSTYSYYVPNICSTIDFSAPAVAGKNVVEYLQRMSLVYPNASLKLVANENNGAYKRCDYNVTPANYVSVIAGIPKTSATWRGVCFAAGTYTAPLVLDGVTNIALIGAGRSATTLETTIQSTSNPLATLTLAGKNIVIADMTVRNRYTYHINPVNPNDTQTTEVSFALVGQSSAGITIRNSLIESFGKATLSLYSSDMSRVLASTINSAYFAVNATDGNYLIDNTQISQNLASDQHSLVWTAETNYYFRNIRTSTPTGRSFLSGANMGTRKDTYIENLTPLTPLDSWAQQHPNYKGMHIHLVGSYPTISDYWSNPFDGGGVSADTSISRE